MPETSILATPFWQLAVVCALSLALILIYFKLKDYKMQQYLPPVTIAPYESYGRRSMISNYDRYEQ